jgi:hypothetical protein
MNERYVWRNGGKVVKQAAKLFWENTFQMSLHPPEISHEIDLHRARDSERTATNHLNRCTASDLHDENRSASRFGRFYHKNNSACALGGKFAWERQCACVRACVCGRPGEEKKPTSAENQTQYNLLVAIHSPGRLRGAHSFQFSKERYADIHNVYTTVQNS